MDKNEGLSFQLELTLTEADQKTTIIKREKDDRNRESWPSLAIKIIIEMLVNINPPSAVNKNIESTVRLVCPQADVRDLPNADHVRKMRGIIRILTETLSACELEKVFNAILDVPTQ